MLREYHTTTVNPHGREEELQWVRILASGNPVKGMVLAEMLFAVTGNMLLSVAIWRSGVLPKWAGLHWIIGTLVFYVLGAFLGMATTNASLPTQPVGALLMAISGAWIAWTVVGSRTAPNGIAANQPIDRISPSPRRA